MIKAKRTKIIRDVHHIDGFLKKGTAVKVQEISDSDVRIEDMTGRIFWVRTTDLEL